MRVAVITGAAKGLGLETARQLSELGLRTILTGRNATALAAAAASVPQAEWHVLDVADGASVATFFGWLEGSHGRLDVLVNNAGRTYGAHRRTVVDTDVPTVAEAIDNNALGALRMMQRALPMMARNGHGRIVNVSSGMGALTDMGSGSVPYRVSKTALNALTILAAHEAASGVKVNAVCPGWVGPTWAGRAPPGTWRAGRAASSGLRRFPMTDRPAASSAMAGLPPGSIRKSHSDSASHLKTLPAV